MGSRARRPRAKPDAGAPAAPGLPGHEEQTLSRATVAWLMVLFAAAAGVLIWKQSTVYFLSWTDEQIHFYVARRVAEGAVLYRDIDSARPPLVLFPIVWLIKLGLPPLFAGRAMVVASQLATACLLLWGGWRLVSLRTGTLAALLFLSSPEVFSRIHYTGIHLVALTSTACVLSWLRAQPLRTGLFLGLTLATDQHGLVVCGMAALLTIVRRPRDGMSLALGILVTSGMVFGGVWAMGGRHLWHSLVGVHLFHLRVGQGVNAQFWEQLKPWLYEHGYLVAGAGLATVLLAARRADLARGDARPPRSRVARLLLLVVVGHVAVVLAMTEAAFLYVVVIAPLLALLAGMGLDASLAWWRGHRQGSRARARRASRVLAGGLVAGLALIAGGWSGARSHREKLDERPYSLWPHVLHGQVSQFHRLDVALQGIADPMLPKEGSLFGDPTIVSALALRSGKRVAGELADLNPNWIEAGTVRAEEVVARIQRDGVTAVVSPPWGILQQPYFKSYLFACYQRPEPFFPPPSGPGQGLPLLLVFTHGPTPCQPPAP